MFGEKFATRLNSFTSKPEAFWGKLIPPLTVDKLIQRAGTVKGLTDLDLNFPDHAGENLKNIINTERWRTFQKCVGFTGRFCRY